MSEQAEGRVVQVIGPVVDVEYPAEYSVAGMIQEVLFSKLRFESAS